MTQKFSIKGFADNSITGEKIAGFTTATDGYVMAKSSGNITWQQMDSDPTMGGDMTGTASNAQIAANSVGTTELADNSVTSDKIGVDVIVAEDIAANAITVAELQDGAVTFPKIKEDNITQSAIKRSIHKAWVMGG